MRSDEAEALAAAVATGIVQQLAPHIAELRAEVGLHAWHEDENGSKWRDLSRVATLERQVVELFERCTKAEAKAAALESAFETGFKPDFVRAASEKGTL